MDSIVGPGRNYISMAGVSVNKYRTIMTRPITSTFECLKENAKIKPT